MDGWWQFWNGHDWSTIWIPIATISTSTIQIIIRAHNRHTIALIDLSAQCRLCALGEDLSSLQFWTCRSGQFWNGHDWSTIWIPIATISTSTIQIIIRAHNRHTIALIDLSAQCRLCALGEDLSSLQFWTCRSGDPWYGGLSFMGVVNWHEEIHKVYNHMYKSPEQGLNLSGS